MGVASATSLFNSLSEELTIVIARAGALLAQMSLGQRRSGAMSHASTQGPYPDGCRS